MKNSIDRYDEYFSYEYIMKISRIFSTAEVTRKCHLEFYEFIWSSKNSKQSRFVVSMR